MELPRGGILRNNAVHSHALATVEEQKSRSADGICLDIHPPVGVVCVSVHLTGAYYGNILGVLREDERLMHRHGVTLPGAEVHRLTLDEIRDLTGDNGIFRFIGATDYCLSTQKGEL